jgi:hypothetical protein
MTPLRALCMHESRGKVNLTLMADRMIWRVRRREVTRVSRHVCREQAAECCNATFHEAGSETLGCKGRQSRVEVADVRVRERGTVSICRPSPAFPPLRGREGKCERRHEHRSKRFPRCLRQSARLPPQEARDQGYRSPNSTKDVMNSPTTIWRQPSPRPGQVLPLAAW